MKTILLVVAGFFVLGAIIFSIVWKATSGVAEAANNFLSLTASRGPEASWSTASPAFQQATPEDVWKIFAQQSGLTTY